MNSKRNLLILATLIIVIGIGFTTIASVWPKPQPVDNPRAITQPEGTMSLDSLLSEATYQAEGYGLQIIDSQEYVWMSLGDWMSEMGITGGILDPQIPLLIVAMRGSGSWAGAGWVPSDYKMQGLTLALDGFTGDVLTSSGGYELPTGKADNVYRQILNHPTFVPITPIISNQTAEPRPDSTPQPLPTSAK